ncbi:MAG TPA: site-specific integrase, partial [Dongiaceae bacterium]|nr:site-specific integrase [Dongiaceae bacterium]
LRETPYWPFALIALTTGLRRGEILGLTWADVDLERGLLQVQQVVGECAGEVFIRPKPKTPAGCRQITLPPVLVEELIRIRRAQAEERLAYGAAYRRDLDLCLALPGGAPWNPNLLTCSLAWIARKTGLPKNCAPLHSLRHHHATALIATTPLKVVSARLGHASIKVTADTYQHSSEELDRGAAAAIEALVRPLVTKPER